MYDSSMLAADPHLQLVRVHSRACPKALEALVTVCAFAKYSRAGVRCGMPGRTASLREAVPVQTLLVQRRSCEKLHKVVPAQ